MTLASLRKLVWNNRSPDVELFYKKKGNKVINGEKVEETPTSEESVETN
jgi:hypothetical protein